MIDNAFVIFIHHTSAGLQTAQLGIQNERHNRFHLFTVIMLHPGCKTHPEQVFQKCTGCPNKLFLRTLFCEKNWYLVHM